MLDSFDHFCSLILLPLSTYSIATFFVLSFRFNCTLCPLLFIFFVLFLCFFCSLFFVLTLSLYLFSDVFSQTFSSVPASIASFVIYFCFNCPLSFFMLSPILHSFPLICHRFLSPLFLTFFALFGCPFPSLFSLLLLCYSFFFHLLACFALNSHILYISLFSFNFPVFY